MKISIIMLLTLATCVWGQKARKLESLPQEKYTELALQELKAMGESRFLSDLNTPKCKINKRRTAVKCTVKFKWMQVQRKVAVKLAFATKKAQLKLSLFFDNEELIQQEVNLAEVCSPLPKLLRQIDICAQIYYINVDTKPPALSFDSCFLVKISDVFHLKLNCVKLTKDGRFIQHSKREPDGDGIFEVSLENGNVIFSVNSPIPDDIKGIIAERWEKLGNNTKDTMDKIGDELQEIWTDAEQELTEIGGKISKFGKDVRKSVSEGIDGIDNRFENSMNNMGQKIQLGLSKAGQKMDKLSKKIGKEWDNAGEKLNKVGKKFEKGVKNAKEKIKNTFTDIGNKLSSIFS